MVSATRARDARAAAQLGIDRTRLWRSLAGRGRGLERGRIFERLACARIHPFFGEKRTATRNCSMIVNRKPLTFWEKLYVPAIIGGRKVTLRHAYNTMILKKVVTMEYPEQKWALPPDYRGAPYLVKDQDGNTKCVSCQLCEFVCPPKAIRITPPDPAGH